MQLLFKYGARAYLTSGEKERDFTFAHLGQLRKHHETIEESARRKSALSVEMSQRVEAWLRDQHSCVCSGSLGKVYVDDGLRYAAVPLQEGASMGGFGTLPRGTRIPLPEGKKVRAFTYWKKVDDIDLSCFAPYDDGERASSRGALRHLPPPARSSFRAIRRATITAGQSTLTWSL